jgi:hypothetical protein
LCLGGLRRRLPPPLELLGALLLPPLSSLPESLSVRSHHHHHRHRDRCSVWQAQGRQLKQQQ